MQTDIDQRLVATVKKRLARGRMGPGEFTEMALTAYSKMLLPMSEAQRDVIFLCHLGWGIDEIAQKVGKTEQWVIETLDNASRRIDEIFGNLLAGLRQ